MCPSVVKKIEPQINTDESNLFRSGLPGLGFYDLAKVSKAKKKSRSTSKKRSKSRRRSLVPPLYFLVIVSSLIAVLYLYTKYDTTLRPSSKPAKPTTNTVIRPKTEPLHRRNKLKQQPPVTRPSLPTTLIFYRLEQNFSQAIRHRKTFDQTLTKRQKAQQIIQLLTLSRAQDLAPLPHHTTLITASFIAPLITIDLSDDLTKGAVNFGGRDEMLAVSCLTNSFLANFPGFNALQILIEGEKRETLAGHIDISQPLRYQSSIKE